MFDGRSRRRFLDNGLFQTNYRSSAIQPRTPGRGVVGDADLYLVLAAAAIVLNDLGSSAFYAGGLAEEAVGKAAPWLILGVVVFSYAVRAVYVESCSMFTRGGVYRIVKEALGGTFAKVSVSALMFDYVLTGPISGVSAGQYIVGMLNDLAGVLARQDFIGPWHRI